MKQANIKTISHLGNFYYLIKNPSAKSLFYYVLMIFIVTSLCSHRYALAANNRDANISINEVGASVSTKFQRLAAKAQLSGRVPVILKLNTGYMHEGFLSKSRVPIQRNAIANAQTSVISSLAGLNTENIKRLKYTPYLGMTVDVNALRALSKNPMVLDVYEDVLRKPTLIDSTGIIKANVASQLGYDGAGWVVAVLDTGVDKTHPFLSGKVVSEACYSTTGGVSTSLCPGGVSTSTATDSGLNCAQTTAGCDHGTHVAGIIAGRDYMPGGPGYDGVAKGADIIAIQVFSQITGTSNCDPNPSPCTLAYDIDILRGLDRIYELRVVNNWTNIAAINMSLGGGTYTSNCDSAQSAYKDNIESLRLAGIATIVATGNSFYRDAIGTPACVSPAISVGATCDSALPLYKPSIVNCTGIDAVPNYSNIASFISLLAPGSLISSSTPNNNYSDYDGTSMAAPHVAGAWAVLRQMDSVASVSTILTALQNTGVTVDDLRQAGINPLDQSPLPAGSVTGMKRIDIEAALSYLAAVNGPSVSIGINDGVSYPYTGDVSNVSTTHQIITENYTDTCVNPGTSCMYKFRIIGQSSADSLISSLPDTSGVTGQVTFDFITSGAPSFDIKTEIDYKGVVAVDAVGLFVDPAGPAIAGNLAVTSAGLGGLSTNLSGANIPRGAVNSSQEFIAQNYTHTVNNVQAGVGSLTLDIDISCASDGGFLVNGGECISAIGMPSLLFPFDVNMPFDPADPTYGIFVTLTFTPIAALDQLPPLLTITSPSNNTPVNSSNITLHGTATDAGQGDNGISSVTINSNAAANSTANGSNTANWSYNAALTSGTNNFTIIATDGSQNANQTTNVLVLNYIPFVVDTDGDGLDDSFEIAIGTNPNLVDSDGDGRSDSQELGYDGDNSFYNQNTDTDPTDSDSDDDGFSDGDEIAAGTDPLDPMSHPIPDGDINGDGLVDVADLLLAMRIMNGQYMPTQAEQNRWDVAPLVGGVPQPDGQNTVGDLVVLQRKVTGQINF